MTTYRATWITRTTLNVDEVTGLRNLAQLWNEAATGRPIWVEVAA